MTWTIATEQIAKWVPWATAAGTIWRLYHTGRASVTEWADKLLDNHMAHLQASLDKQTELLEKIASK